MGDMTCLLLLLLAGVTVSTAMDLYKRITGGQECGNNERHYHVKLKFNNGDICGGSLISDRWVLTAKHCENPSTAHLGLHPRTGKNTPEMKIIEQKPFAEGHDIIMMKLDKAVNTGDIKPATLPLPEECKNRPKKGDTVQIAGYAATVENGGLSPTLQCAKPKVDDCPESNDPGHEFCIGLDSPAFPMPGDSGGGVEYNKKLYGVISFGIMFMDVCEYLDWINETKNKA